MHPASRIIIALDFENLATAMHLVKQLGDSAKFYKVGLQLLTAEGPSVVQALISAGKQVFLDLKLFEIPNSVAGAVRAAGQLGVSMVTVHAMAGSTVLRAAVEAARPFPHLKILGLTVISSMREADLYEVGVKVSIAEQGIRLAQLATAAACQGIVASPQEVALLRRILPTELLLVTPGIQLPGHLKNDQARICTPEQALDAGASHLVIGRSISHSENPAATFSAICEQLVVASRQKKSSLLLQTQT
ncbi:MAG: orotidine-5'-phosphate decarboxylase [Burkholderiaceae bacterium]|nr:orotidine-5'-phosphate decarboxylase [Burkholderiaceae bacterium]